VERATGTISEDVLRGDDGNNQLRGLGGYDWFIATEGQDTIDGGAGQDMISFVEYENTSTDALLDVFGTDGLPPAADMASGIVIDLAAPENNSGLAAGLTLTSVERVTGSSYQDVFFGDDGQNNFRGLGGYDWFVSSAGGRERYYGGSGLDTVSYVNADGAITAHLSNGAGVAGQETGYGTRGDAALDLYFEIENLAGSRFDDALRGSSGRNQLNGLDGDDLIFGFGGTDYPKGGNGNDRIDGGADSDYALYDGAQSDYTLIRSSATEVTVTGQGFTDTVSNVEYFRFDDGTTSIWELSIV